MRMVQRTNKRVLGNGPTRGCPGYWFSAFLPCGEGLIAFRDPEGAMRGIKAIRKDYDIHTRRARQIIEAHFDSRKVLTDLLEKSL